MKNNEKDSKKSTQSNEKSLFVIELVKPTDTRVHTNINYQPVK